MQKRKLLCIVIISVAIILIMFVTTIPTIIIILTKNLNISKTRLTTITARVTAITTRMATTKGIVLLKEKIERMLSMIHDNV